MPAESQNYAVTFVYLFSSLQHVRFQDPPFLNCTKIIKEFLVVSVLGHKLELKKSFEPSEFLMVFVAFQELTI